MSYVVSVAGALLFLLGIVGVVSPAALASVVTRWQSPTGLHLAAGIRVVLGIAFLVAAAESRSPLFLRVMGWILIVTGALTPLLGLRRFEGLLEWWKRRSLLFRRSWAGLAAAIGAAIAWVAVPAGGG